MSDPQPQTAELRDGLVERLNEVASRVGCFGLFDVNCYEASDNPMDWCAYCCCGDAANRLLGLDKELSLTRSALRACQQEAEYQRARATALEADRDALRARVQQLTEGLEAADSALRMLVDYLRRAERWPVKAEHNGYLMDAEHKIREVSALLGAGDPTNE